MDSFSLFRLFRTVAGASTSAAALPEPPTDDDTDDEGPFFDLEFASPDENDHPKGGEDGEEDDKDVNFSSNSSSDGDSKTQLNVSLLKSATKFRVFILGLRKSKSAAVESNAVNAACVSPKSKFLFVKFKVEEAPLFTCEGSSRNQASIGCKNREIDASAEEKMRSFNSKEVVQRYLSKIKPLYVRVSKRYADKLRFSGPLFQSGFLAAEDGGEEEKDGEEVEVAELRMAEKNSKLQLPAKLKVVCERLGKSRSAAAAVAAVSSPKQQQQRRDDSLLQQQDGIQSAIAHCKRSFTASSKETESPLQLSESNPEA